MEHCVGGWWRGLAISSLVVNGVLLLVLVLLHRRTLRWKITSALRFGAEQSAHLHGRRHKHAIQAPKYCKARPSWGRYACFISHYKVEAGTEARVMSDKFEAMLGHAVFLDSNNLTDIRALYAAVAKSDVLLLLATRSVLTRHFCLLEIWEASRSSTPVLVVQVEGGGFRRAEARYLLENLETELPLRNPEALVAVRQHLSQTNTPLSQFKRDVLDALRLCGPRESFRTQRTDTSKSGDELSFLVDPSSAGRHRLAFSQLPFVWRPHGTDNALVADAKDVIEEMASLTNRTLRWPKSHRHTLAVTRQKKVSRSKLIYKIQDDIATCRGRGQGSTSRSRPSELNSALDGSMTSLSGGSSLTNTTRPPSRSSWLPRLDAFRAQGAGYTSRSRGERSFGLFVSFDHKLTPLAEKLAASVAPMVMRNGPVHVASIDNPVAYASSESGSSTAIGATDQGGSSQRLVRLTTAKHALWMGADMPALLRLALAARIEYGVGKSHGLILLQTSAVLHHPITLLEVFKAIMNEIPIVCVKVHGAGYSFARAQRYLAELTETDAGKYPAAHAAVCEWLRERGIKFGTFKYALFSTIPSIISIALDPKRSDNHWHAVALDVVEKRNITSEHNQVKDRSSDRDSSNRSRFESRDPSCRDSSPKDSRARPTPITPEPSCNSTMRSRVTLRRQSTTSCSTTDATASLSTTTTWKRVQRMDQMASVARNAGVLNESGDDEVGLMSLIAVQGRVRGFLARIDSRSSTSRRSSVRRDSTWTPHLTESSAPGRTDMGRRSDFSEGSHISTVNRRKSAGDMSRSKLIGMHISRESTPRDRSRSAPGDRASSSSRRESTGSASSVERALQAHLVTEMELERCSSSGSGQEGNYTARSKRKAVALREVVVDR